MQVRCAHQPPKVSGIFGDDDAVLGDASCKNAVVRLTPPTDVKRMNRIMFASRVKPCCKLR